MTENVPKSPPAKSESEEQQLEKLKAALNLKELENHTLKEKIASLEHPSKTSFWKRLFQS